MFDLDNLANSEPFSMITFFGSIPPVVCNLNEPQDCSSKHQSSSSAARRIVGERRARRGGRPGRADVNSPLFATTQSGWSDILPRTHKGRMDKFQRSSQARFFEANTQIVSSCSGMPDRMSQLATRGLFSRSSSAPNNCLIGRHSQSNRPMGIGECLRNSASRAVLSFCSASRGHVWAVVNTTLCCKDKFVSRESFFTKNHLAGSERVPPHRAACDGRVADRPFPPP